MNELETLLAEYTKYMHDHIDGEDLTDEYWIEMSEQADHNGEGGYAKNLYILGGIANSIVELSKDYEDEQYHKTRAEALKMAEEIYNIFPCFTVDGVELFYFGRSSFIFDIFNEIAQAALDSED